jgi:hypothetical protein
MRRWLVILALAAACTKAPTASPDVVAGEDGADGAADAAEPGADGAADGDASADVAAPGHVTTFTITVAAGLALPPGRLHVRLVNYIVPVGQPTPYDDVIFDGTVDLPTTVTAVVPSGTWWPIVGWLDSGDKPLATNFSCDKSSVFTVSASQPAPDQIQLTLNSLGNPPSCPSQPPPAFLGEVSSYIVPFTDTGVTHLLEGVAYNGLWWIASNADGFGRVDLPGNGKQVSNWQSLGQGMCRHIARRENRLFCSQRDPSIVWVDLDPVSNAVTGKGELALPAGVHAEGILVEGDTLYATLHSQGLVAVPLNPPGPPVLLQAPGLNDAWHVAALGGGNLVVANGSAGIAIVKPQNGKLTVLATLPLPGLSAHVAVQGTTIAVGALGGGLHLIDAADPTKPVLLGTLPAGPWPIVGVDLQDGMAYAAAARGVMAVPVPKQPVAQLAAIAFTPTDLFMTLDARVVGDVLLTAEYGLVRALTVKGTQPPSGLPMAIAEAQTWAPVVAVGANAQYTVYVWNPGAAPLHLSHLNVHQTPPNAQSTALGPPLPFTAPDTVTIAPGQTVAIALTVQKLAIGVQDAVLRLQSDDPYKPFLSVHLTESPLLNLGKPLPALSYQDAKGKLTDAVAQLAGKPGLLIVTAASCPVALERTGALLQEFGALIAGGKLNALLLNPWDKPGVVEMGTVPIPFTELFSALTSNDDTQHSAVSDELLALPGLGPVPPLPHLFVLDAKGNVTYAHLGFAPVPLRDAVKLVLGL